MKFLTIACGATAVAASLSKLVERQSNWTVGQTVQTSSGPVKGHAASNATEVSEYLGIPFANPPIGDLRWAPPQKYSGNTTINGTTFGFSCPANTAVSNPGSTSNIANANITAAGLHLLRSLGQFGDKFSEDCLTLNVWTKPQAGEAKKAVLLWIYGGGFATGNSNNPAYNGQFIADQEDVVVVSINYRLNIFGFPGSPGTTQNLGLLDQRLGVEWVRDNIATFGGDPDRITLFGQSAGGASVDYHIFAWTDDPIVAGFIPQSGTAVGIVPATLERRASAWYNVSSELGCGGASSDSDDVLTCMRTKTYTSILAAFPESGGTRGTSGFGPTIDEVVVFSDYLNRSRAGNFTKRPLLTGNTDDEAGLYRTISALSGQTMPESYWKGFNEVGFNCPAALRSNISVANSVPTWRYRWFGVFPNTRLTSAPESGAWHASELAVLFDTTPKSAGIPADTPEEIAIGKYLRGAWAAFAKDPANGLKTYGGGWPTYVPGQDTLIRLAYENKTGTNVALSSTYDDVCNSTFLVTGSPTDNGSATGTGSAPGTTTSTSGTQKQTVTAILVAIMIGFSCLL